MPLNAPHTPHAPGDAFIGKSKLDIYGDFMVEVDHQIGRVMNALDRLKLTDNTLVIVTSDNGPETNMYPRRSKFGHDSSSHFLGAKRDNWEGGHRVPFIARWPGVIAPGSTCDTPFCLVDMMATFSELLSVELPTDQGVDSVSILPLMLGKGDDNRKAHAIIHHSSSGRFAIRNGDWKLLLHAGSGGNGYGAGQRSSRYNGTIEQRSFDTANRQLYNMRTDPDETTNLIEIRPDVVSELTALAGEYVRQGRSTPGPHLKTDLQNWPQIDWLSPHAIPAASGNTSDENKATGKPKLNKKRTHTMKLSSHFFYAFSMLAEFASAEEKQSKPNVVILLADDLGSKGSRLLWRASQNTSARQPGSAWGQVHDFHAGAAVCSPSRATLLTGRQNLRTGIYSVLQDHMHDMHLLEREVTIAEVLQQAGYGTAHFGKWHVGMTSGKRKKTYASAARF